MKFEFKYIFLFVIGFAIQTNSQVVKDIKNNIQKGNLNTGYNANSGSWNEVSSDSTYSNLEEVPESIYVWHLDPKFGGLISAEIDTLQHLFQNEALTSGIYGTYNFTGNLGAPRISRIFSNNRLQAFENQFIFKNHLLFI